MPVALVLTHATDGVDSLLLGVADGIGSALGLAPADVIAVHVPTAAALLSGGGDVSWPVVLIIGSSRGAERDSFARVAAEDAVREWAASTGFEVAGVSAEWVSGPVTGLLPRTSPESPR